MNSAKFNIEAEPNGTVVISNEDSRITIRPDGTIAISSHAPVQLTGACLSKLDIAKLSNDGPYAAALMQRLPKKSTN